MNILSRIKTKLFRPKLTRFEPGQHWVLHGDDGESLVTHTLAIEMVGGGMVGFVEHTFWRDEEGEDGYHQIKHEFTVEDLNRLVVDHCFVLLPSVD